MDARADSFFFPRRLSDNFSHSTLKRNAERINNISTDGKTDIIVEVDDVSFSLHKIPLMKRSGRFQRLIGNELNEPDSVRPLAIEFSNFPGGAETFELATRFCYGMNFEITPAKVAYLRCAAEFLEMTDNYGEDNLISRTESFLNDVVFESLEKTAEVLHTCESIMAMAEEVRLVNRCIDVLASKVCIDQPKLFNLLQMEGGHSGRWNNKLDGSAWDQDNGGNQHGPKVKVEWWAECLSPLRVDLYQRVFAAMKANGLRNEVLAGSLMHYVKASLKGLQEPSSKGTSAASPTAVIRSKTKHHMDISFTNSPRLVQQHEQRILLETVVSLLPLEKNMFPTNFLLSLLRSAILLDTTVACRLDLERRIGLQLEQATVDDLLIPSLSSHVGDPVFDVDVVQRVLSTYLHQEEKASCESLNINEVAGSQRGVTKVAKVMDMYLAEIAPDPNLSVAKFLLLAEQLPSYARVLDDGLYRAVDIFLKAHPSLPDMDRRKICKVINCQKLSRDACVHAAQNERLPVQMVVQVLYFEQIRMRDAMGGAEPNNRLQGCRHHHKGSGGLSPDLETCAGLRQENLELKEQVARLQALVAELQKENAALKNAAEEKSTGLNGNSGSFFSLMSRRLGKMNPFSTKLRETANNKPMDTRATPRRRRHSIS